MLTAQSECYVIRASGVAINDVKTRVGAAPAESGVSRLDHQAQSELPRIGTLFGDGRVLCEVFFVFFVFVCCTRGKPDCATKDSLSLRLTDDCG